MCKCLLMPRSLCLAAPAGCLPDPALVALFGFGSLVMRGAGCTINDMWDRNIDSRVARTRDRPITAGQVGGPTWLTRNRFVSVCYIAVLRCPCLTR